ncbi:hypothetical protein AcW1_002473 [Taiwanofungus camphoratus]|nr:hypothetical protein AcW1_002473 [Antrodia cinnamomea]
MQWGIVRCCRVLSVGSCIESVAGIFQLTLQWALFTIILVLYMIYFPPHLKYAAVALDVDTGADTHDSRPPRAKASIKSDAWRLSIILSWVVFLHIALITFVTFLLLSNFAPSPGPDSPHERRVHAWATFLGVTSALLAALQYAPQLVHTAKLRYGTQYRAEAQYELDYMAPIRSSGCNAGLAAYHVPILARSPSASRYRRLWESDRSITAWFSCPCDQRAG